MDHLNIASFIVGVIGLLVGIWGGCIGYKSKQTKCLEYSIFPSELIKDGVSKIPGLENALKGEFTSDLTSTTIEFVSRGTATIIDSDFATLAPLKVISTGHFFNLETIKEQISSNNPNFNPKVTVIDEKTFSIAFEYLKSRQTFSISVLHDGKISVSGDLKSGKLRERQNGPESETKIVKGNTFFTVVVYILLATFTILSTIFLYTFSRKDLEEVTNKLINQAVELKKDNYYLQSEIDRYQSECESLQRQLTMMQTQSTLLLPSSSLDPDCLPDLSDSDPSK